LSFHVLKINDKIFAMVTHGRLVVKLPSPRFAALVSERLGEPFDPATAG
jgi:hypothetical protein